MARSENKVILEEILPSAIEITEENMEQIFTTAGIPQDLFILATNGAVYSFFNRNNAFLSQWRKDTEKLEVNGFEGWYQIGGGKIPVFNIYDSSNERRILLLNKRNLVS